MNRIHAHLCGRCVNMLRETFYAVEEISKVGSHESVCPWCQKNRPDGLYRIEIKKE